MSCSTPVSSVAVTTRDVALADVARALASHEIDALLMVGVPGSKLLREAVAGVQAAGGAERFRVAQIGDFDIYRLPFLPGRIYIEPERDDSPSP